VAAKETAPPKPGPPYWAGERPRGTIDAIRWAGPKKPTLEELRELLQKEGLDSEVYSDPPRMKYGRHKHPFDDFVVIVSGRMRIATDTHEWILKPGDRLDIPANTPHTAEMLGKEEVRWLSAAK
jgi:quercetin dioxygenase-like cupin family protein